MAIEGFISSGDVVRRGAEIESRGCQAYYGGPVSSRLDPLISVLAEITIGVESYHTKAIPLLPRA